MESATILLSPSIGLSSILLSARTQYSWSIRKMKKKSTLNLIYMSTKYHHKLKWYELLSTQVFCLKCLFQGDDLKRKKGGEAILACVITAMTWYMRLPSCNYLWYKNIAPTYLSTDRLKDQWIGRPLPGKSQVLKISIGRIIRTHPLTWKTWNPPARNC